MFCCCWLTAVGFDCYLFGLLWFGCLRFAVVLVWFAGLVLFTLVFCRLRAWVWVWATWRELALVLRILLGFALLGDLIVCLGFDLWIAIMFIF